jgi:hypothetical protein
MNDRPGPAANPGRKDTKMTNREKRHLREVKEIRKCAKALYIVSGLTQMCNYLRGAVYEIRSISEEEAEQIGFSVEEECAGLHVSYADEIRQMVLNAGEEE